MKKSDEGAATNAKIAEKVPRIWLWQNIIRPEIETKWNSTQ